MSYRRNDRIVVTKRSGKYKKYDLLHKHGTIVGYYEDEYKIKIDNIDNPRSAEGVFYLSARLFELEDAYEETFETESEVTVMDGNYKVVLVAFLDKPHEQYKYACYEENINVGDVCMVKSKRHGFGIAEVIELIEDNDEPLVREIVARIDMSAYNSRVAQRKLRTELKQKMEERANKLQEIALYELLAKEDKEMAELLKAYKGA